MEVRICEVCGNEDLELVINLGMHPLCDDLVPITCSDRVPEYPIEILYCEKCRTAHQKHQVEKRHLFPPTYHYRSRFTADVVNGMKELVASVEQYRGSLENLKVLDVGCNDGSLLDQFSAKGARTYGIEPTGASIDAQGRAHIVVNDFFNEDSAAEFVRSYGTVDVVTFTNVFAHIEDLQALLRALKMVMHEDTTLVIENHYLGSVLVKNQFDTFYHEHPRTYSLSSFLFVAERLNRKILSVEFPGRYGGNIRVCIGSSNSKDPAFDDTVEKVISSEAKFHNSFVEMRNFISRWQKSKRDEIDNLVAKYGSLPAKAFPGRAAILVKMLSLSPNEIYTVFEKPGSLKIGNLVPGTQIPISSDDLLVPNLSKTPVILNLAWHIPSEIENYMAGLGFEGQIVQIVDNDAPVL